MNAMAKTATAAVGAALLGGCVSIHDHRGAVVDPQLASAVQVGVDDKHSVEQMLGRPTFTSEFNDNDWYYVSRDTRTFAFRNPRVTKQTVVHVSFDKAGNVVAVDRTGRELVAKINPAPGETPTVGRKRTLLEDIFGNLGGVGGAASPGGDSGGGQGPQ